MFPFHRCVCDVYNFVLFLAAAFTRHRLNSLYSAWQSSFLTSDFRITQLAYLAADLLHSTINSGYFRSLSFALLTDSIYFYFSLCYYYLIDLGSLDFCPISLIVQLLLCLSLAVLSEFLLLVHPN